ncbi:hypothetical protein M8818_000215 [Zalaria obscura]|uniref:Uncharacterized protein n=1 Tax=Zalaria obscura TaxID=2024903 RepID=A0ACC3SQE3_9PEZI
MKQHVAFTPHQPQRHLTSHPSHSPLSLHLLHIAAPPLPPPTQPIYQSSPVPQPKRPPRWFSAINTTSTHRSGLLPMSCNGYTSNILWFPQEVW